MKKILKITVELENDAFATPADRIWEISRILDNIKTAVHNSGGSKQSHLIYDINGNQVGSWSIKGK